MLQNLKQRKVTISAAELQSRGFPPLEISFDLTATGLACHLFSAEGLIVSMSGPPGGPSSFYIEIIRAEADKPLTTLDALVNERNRRSATFKLGKEYALEFNGRRSTVLYWENKIGPWHDNHASALFPLPAFFMKTACDKVLSPLPEFMKNAGVADSALYIEFSAYLNHAGELTPCRDQAIVLKSLKWNANPISIENTGSERVL